MSDFKSDESSPKQQAVAIVYKTTGFDPEVDKPVIVGMYKFDTHLLSQEEAAKKFADGAPDAATGYGQFSSWRNVEIENLSVDDERFEEFVVNPKGVPLNPSARAAFSIDHDMERFMNRYGISVNKLQNRILDFVEDLPIVAHNVSKVKEFFPYLNTPGRTFVDSLRLARHIWPKGETFRDFRLETHKVYELKYWLGIEQDLANSDPTQVVAEAIATGAVTNHAINIALKAGWAHSWEQLERQTNRPIPITSLYIPNKGDVPIANLDLDFLRKEIFSDRAKRLDPDVLHALTTEYNDKLSHKQAEVVQQRSFFGKRTKSTGPGNT